MEQHARGATEDDLVVIPPRPPRPVRRGGGRAGRRRARMRSLLRWALTLLALVLAGSSAVVGGWRSLTAGAEPELRPGPVCVARAVEQAQAFAAVLGDSRPVDRSAVEGSCAGRP